MNMVGIAMGRLDGFWEIDFGGCWDTCAAAVVVTEAGGEVLDPSVSTLSHVCGVSTTHSTHAQSHVKCRGVPSTLWLGACSQPTGRSQRKKQQSLGHCVSRSNAAILFWAGPLAIRHPRRKRYSRLCEGNMDAYDE